MMRNIIGCVKHLLMNRVEMSEMSWNCIEVMS
jgi:hypothetical protein